MLQTFSLTNEMLLSNAYQMKDKIEEGLKAKDQELQCLINYLSPGKQLDSDRAIVLDFGGTNLRAGIASVKNGKIYIEKNIIQKKIPLIRGKCLSKDQFLSIQSEIIHRLKPSPGLSLGYCFSYPTLPLKNGDATLIKWTKEVDVPEVCNQPVGALLKEHLMDSTPSYKCRKLVVINDTIAGLFSGWSTTKADVYIGLIVGTGTNIATFIERDRIPKLKGKSIKNGALAINLESGNFYPKYLSSWDKIVDQESMNPGEQHFEKAVSGEYLCRIFKARFPEVSLPSGEGVPGLLKIIDERETHTQEQIDFALEIIDRSAKLVAAALAGTIIFLSQKRSIKNVSITGEGSLLNRIPGYKSVVKNTLNHLLSKAGCNKILSSIYQIEHANLIGSAVAVLTKEEQM